MHRKSVNNFKERKEKACKSPGKVESAGQVQIPASSFALILLIVIALEKA